MKKLSTNIITENGDVKKNTVFVEDGTAAALAHCDEEIRHLYILEEHEAQNLTRKETRRHISYESVTEKGLDFSGSFVIFYLAMFPKLLWDRIYAVHLI